MDRTPYKRFVLIAAALFISVIALDLINGRLWMSDFRVYWEATGRFLRGEAPYGEAFGLSSGWFKYAPFTLLLFAPWALLPYGLASVLFDLLIAAAMVFGIVRIERLVRERLIPVRSGREAVLWFALLAAVVHLHRELHLGNVNMLLLVLLVCSAEEMLKGAAMRTGILLGLVILVKPHFVVLLPLFLLHKRYRELLISLGVVVIGSLLPALAVGWQANLDLHGGWLHAMAGHNASPFHTDEASRTAADTVYSVLWRISAGTLPATTASALVLLAVIAAAVLLFDRWNASRNKNDVVMRDRHLLFTFLLLVALVPSITPTDTEHFLLSIPMVIFLLHHMVSKDRPKWLVVAGTAVLLAYGGNWQDLWGSWSIVLADHGVLGAANLVLIAMCAYLYGFQQRRAGTS